MSKQNNGDPAFPLMNYTSEIGHDCAGFMAKDSSGKSMWVNSGCPGMSLRDWFAGMAMQGILSSNDGSRVIHELAQESQQPSTDFISEVSFGIADTMLKARLQD